jgi:hypothetical protein
MRAFEDPEIEAATSSDPPGRIKYLRGIAVSGVVEYGPPATVATGFMGAAFGGNTELQEIGVGLVVLGVAGGLIKGYFQQRQETRAAASEDQPRIPEAL